MYIIKEQIYFLISTNIFNQNAVHGSAENQEFNQAKCQLERRHLKSFRENLDTVEDDYLNLSARVTNTMASKEKFDSESITSTTTLTPQHSEIKSDTGASSSVTFEEPSKKEKKPLLMDKKY